MKKYKYHIPGKDGEDVEIIMTETEILDSFYPYWINKMTKKFSDEDLSAMAPNLKRMCIEDWITINWAYKIEE